MDLSLTAEGDLKSSAAEPSVPVANSFLTHTPVRNFSGAGTASATDGHCNLRNRSARRQPLLPRRHETRGKEFSFSGVYREVVAPERLTYTEHLNGEALRVGRHHDPEGVRVAEDYTVTVRSSSIEARDAILRSSMEKGLSRATTLLEQIRPAAMELAATAN